VLDLFLRTYAQVTAYASFDVRADYLRNMRRRPQLEGVTRRLMREGRMDLLSARVSGATASLRSGGSSSPVGMGKSWPRVVLVGVIAATCSGLPSTVHALATGRDPLQATRAAGTLLPGRGNQRGVMAGLVIHVFISAGWTTVLAAVDRRRKLGLLGGIAAGLLIATLDLEVVGRSRPAIRSLPRLPQWLDHITFGAIVGVLLKRSPGRVACSESRCGTTPTQGSKAWRLPW
jgi:hypothetical protein